MLTRLTICVLVSGTEYAAVLYEKGGELQVSATWWPCDAFVWWAHTTAISVSHRRAAVFVQTILDGHQERKLDAQAAEEEGPDSESFKVEQELVRTFCPEPHCTVVPCRAAAAALTPAVFSFVFSSSIRPTSHW